MISVIVPVYNDPNGLQDTLQSLTNQDYTDYEVIVVDNGSTDNTREIAKKFPVKLLVEERRSSYAARNKGVENAKGDVIAFIDADMTVDRNWLSRIAKKDADYLGCKVEIIASKNNIFSRYNSLTGFPVLRYITEKHFIPTCCLVVKRNVFKKIGFFNSNLISNGDLEFGIRVYKAGYKMEYAPNITMYHPARESFCSLFEKYFRIGKGFRQYNPRRKKRFAFLYYFLPVNIFALLETIDGVNWKDKLMVICLGGVVKFITQVGYVYESTRRIF